MWQSRLRQLLQNCSSSRHCRRRFPVHSLFLLTVFLGVWLVVFGVVLMVRGVQVRLLTHGARALAG
jgi:hypothetical protein